jgi:threonine synthase
VAAGLRVPKALGDFLILEDIYASHGEAVAATDSELMDACKEIARLEGMLAAPESGAGMAAIQKLVAAKKIGADESVVLFSTGGGYKYMEAWRSAIG